LVRFLNFYFTDSTLNVNLPVKIEPADELASLLLVTSIDVRHVHLNGTPINGASRHATVETQARKSNILLFILRKVVTR